MTFIGIFLQIDEENKYKLTLLWFNMIIVKYVSVSYKWKNGNIKDKVIKRTKTVKKW